MPFFKLRLADKVIAAECIYSATADFCKDYLTDAEADVSVSVTQGDIAYEARKSAEERALEGFAPQEFSSEYLETLALYRKIAEALVNYGIILFHGSAVSVDGEAYIFTAKSGTGKSTHTRLWREYLGEHCVMVNDDKPLIALTENGVTVYGTPWNGKHRLGSNISADLKAICILGRAEHNSIVKQSPREAFGELFSQTYRFADPMGMKKTLEILDGILRKISIYRLGCNMDIEAAQVAYNEMRGQTDEA